MKGNTKGGQSVRQRCQSRRLNRLAARQAAHADFPVEAGGKQWGHGKARAKQPGSLNPRKH
jgi:hypothetical protein